MRIESLKSKYRKSNVIIKITLSLLNVYFVLINHLNDLDFFFFSLSFNSLIRESTI